MSNHGFIPAAIEGIEGAEALGAGRAAGGGGGRKLLARMCTSRQGGSEPITGGVPVQETPDDDTRYAPPRLLGAVTRTVKDVVVETGNAVAVSAVSGGPEPTNVGQAPPTSQPTSSGIERMDVIPTPSTGHPAFWGDWTPGTGPAKTGREQVSATASRDPNGPGALQRQTAAATGASPAPAATAA
ncbi:MAG: hypothetical protein ACR2JX_01065 [Mycobacteriales bacterium]